jgi:hypothetical protein
MRCYTHLTLALMRIFSTIAVIFDMISNSYESRHGLRYCPREIRSASVGHASEQPNSHRRSPSRSAVVFLPPGKLGDTRGASGDRHTLDQGVTVVT